MVRWKINAVTVVNNNGGGNQSKRGFDRVYGGTQTEGGRTLWTFNKMNFARIAEDIGALGIRVEKPDAFPAALAQALAANRPALIDVLAYSVESGPSVLSAVSAPAPSTWNGAPQLRVVEGATVRSASGRTT